MRASYQELMSNPARIEDILQEGARKARAIATPFIKELRQAVGLRTLGGAGAASAAKAPGKSGKGDKSARFVSFRDDSGQFRFRFLAADGTELFCSVSFADPKLAGAAMRTFQLADVNSCIILKGELGFSIVLNNQVLAAVIDTESSPRRDQHLALLRAAHASLAEAARSGMALPPANGGFL